MPEIYIKSVTVHRVPLEVEAPEGPFHFYSMHPDFLARICTTIDTDGKTAWVVGQALLSDGLYGALESGRAWQNWDNKLDEEFSHFVKVLADHKRRVMALIAQEMRKASLASASYGGTFWSNDNLEWTKISGGHVTAAIHFQPVFRLGRRWVNEIQELLDYGEFPLLATSHLHEAESSSSVRFQWIQATIAAELAIKEVLIRLEPRLTVLLQEVPSPPLRKLYGSVLKDVCGEESPFKSKLAKGAETRNELVHQPSSSEPDPQALWDYIEDVRQAIEHLLSVCRRKNSSRVTS